MIGLVVKYIVTLKYVENLMRNHPTWKTGNLPVFFLSFLSFTYLYLLYHFSQNLKKIRRNKKTEKMLIVIQGSSKELIER